MKKISYRIVLCAVLVFNLLASCAPNNKARIDVLAGKVVAALPDTYPLEGQAIEEFKKEVGVADFQAVMLTDGDSFEYDPAEELKSGDDLVWEALLKAEKDLGVTITSYAAGMEDLEDQLLNVVSEGYDFAVCTSFLFADAIEIVAPQFPDTDFVMVSGGEVAPNVMSVNFSGEEGSFLLGAIAAGMSETGTIGFIGGMDIPVIEKYQAGYITGARAVNPNLKILSGYTESFIDADAARELALDQNSQGADIIFILVGAGNSGVIEAAEDNDFLVVGIEQDWDSTSPGNVVLTSIVTHVEVAIYDAVNASYEGTFIGSVKTYGLASGGVGYSERNYTNTKIPETLLAQVNNLAQRIIDGDFSVPKTREEAYEFTLK